MLSQPTTAISRIYKAYVSVYCVSEGQIRADHITTDVKVCLLLAVTVFPELFTLMRSEIFDTKVFLQLLNEISMGLVTLYNYSQQELTKHSRLQDWTQNMYAFCNKYFLGGFYCTNLIETESTVQ